MEMVMVIVIMLVLADSKGPGGTVLAITQTSTDFTSSLFYLTF